MHGCRVKPGKDFIRFEKAEIEQSIPDRFEKQAAKYPDRLAVKGRNYGLTYRELNESANRLARSPSGPGRT